LEKVYETDRLILKVLDETYAQPVMDYHIRNREFLKEWEPNHPEEFYTLEVQTALLKDWHTHFVKKTALRLWLFKKDSGEDNRIIGAIAFSNIVWGAFLSCHLGYKLDKDEVGRGYITEALRKGISIMFNEYKLHRIEANIMPRNKRSLRVVERLGFYNEGLAKKYLRINGKWEDHIHMVLLNEELE
jgi:ribosomal-protein-alanine N-acetyltransferase